MSYIFEPKVIEGATKKFGDEDRKNLLRAYHEACLDTNCPRSYALLMQRIVEIVAGLPQRETTVVAELSEQELALYIQLKSGANPFSGEGITLTAPVTETSVPIPDSYIGKKYGAVEGLFLRYFDLEDGKGNQPIFVVKLTDPMTYYKAVAATGEQKNGYKADPRTYDAKKGLRQGKTVIASHDILQAAYENKDKNNGAFAEMFKNHQWVLSSSSHPDSPGDVWILDLRTGYFGVYNGLGSAKVPGLLVRKGLTL